MNFQRLIKTFNLFLLYSFFLIFVSSITNVKIGIDRGILWWLLVYLALAYFNTSKIFFAHLKNKVLPKYAKSFESRWKEFLKIFWDDSSPGKTGSFPRLAIRIIGIVGKATKNLLNRLSSLIDLLASEKTSIFKIILAGILLRLVLINVLPITNDEGSYFYDAYLVNRSFAPYRDFLTKSLPHVYVISIVTNFLGNTIFAGRIYTIIIYAINAYLIYLISKKTFNDKIARLALLVLSFYPEIATLTTYAQIQQIQSFFCLLFVYLVVKEDYGVRNLFLMAVLVLLAYISRPTSIIFIPVFFIFLLYLYIKKEISLLDLLKKTSLFLIFLTVLTTATFIVVRSNLNYVKTLDFFGIETVAQTNPVASNISLIESLSIRFNNARTFFNFLANMPILLTSLFFLFFLGFFKNYRIMIVFLSLLVPLNFYLSARSIYYTYYSSTLALSYLPETLTAFVLVLLIFYNSLKRKTEADVENTRKYSVIILAWFVFIASLYAFWIKFNEPYFIEFIPILVLSIGFLYRFIDSNRIKNANRILAFVLIFSMTFSQIRSFTRFYTGTYKPEFIDKVKKVIDDNSQQDDEILTASLIFPFISNRNIPLNISHPYWYGYPFIDKNLLETYMPDLETYSEEMVKNPPKLIIYDKTTYETFFRQSKTLRTILKSKYTKVYDGSSEIKRYFSVYRLSE